MRSHNQSSPTGVSWCVGTVHARQETINEEMEFWCVVHNENCTCWQCIKVDAGINARHPW